MGFLWDIIQQNQLSEHATRTGTLEQRVASLEDELRRTQQTLRDVVRGLEQRLGEDLDRDGRIG
jgi:hypothetical protein